MPISDKKLGTAVLIFLLLFICGISSVFVWVVYLQPKTFVIKFERTGNLKIDDSVVEKGLMMGRVKSIKWQGDHVLVAVETSHLPRLCSDYSITDIEKGVMGDRMLMIRCGDSATHPVSISDTLQGIFVPGISEGISYAGRLGEIVKELDSLARVLRFGTSDRRSLIAQISDLVNSTDTFTMRLTATANELDVSAGPFLDSMQHALATLTRAAYPIMQKAPGQLRSLKTGSDTLAAIATMLQDYVDIAQTLFISLNGRDETEKTQRIKSLYGQLDDIRQLLDFIRRSGLLLRIGI